MADITMCLNNQCVARSYCYRQTATPNPTRQSMASFSPSVNEIGEKFQCEHYYSRQEEWFKQQDAN